MSKLDLSIYNASAPVVFAGKCPQCGTLHYPVAMVCKKCGTRRDPTGIVHDNWPLEPLSGECTLLTWTRVYALPEGYESQYLIFGIVEFPNGLKASGRVEAGDPKIGMTLNAHAIRADEGVSGEHVILSFTESM